MLSGRGDEITGRFTVDRGITFHPDTAAIRVSGLDRNRYHPTDQFFSTTRGTLTIGESPFFLSTGLQIGRFSLLQSPLTTFETKELGAQRWLFSSLRLTPAAGFRLHGRFGSLRLDGGPFFAIHNGGFDLTMFGANVQGGAHAGIEYRPAGLPLEWSFFGLLWRDLAQSRFGDRSALTRGASLRGQISLDISALSPNALPAGSQLFIGGGVDDSTCHCIPAHDQSEPEAKGFVGISIPLP